ncbi:hypothetical protein KGMB02408_47560 [Bacteroides faecalis]|nr:hypothetical protein KGMB02408_47560 [Bacteroides faecalis]
MPDISTKAKAQQYIGLDMDAEKAAKEKFLNTTVPAWLQKAKAAGRLAQK